jgi:hypothetical protein
MPTKMTKIYVFVDGGVVQGVSSTDPMCLRVEVIDYDNLREEKNKKKMNRAIRLSEDPRLADVWP